MVTEAGIIYERPLRTAQIIDVGVMKRFQIGEIDGRPLEDVQGHDFLHGNLKQRVEQGDDLDGLRILATGRLYRQPAAVSQHEPAIRCLRACVAGQLGVERDIGNFLDRHLYRFSLYFQTQRSSVQANQDAFQHIAIAQTHDIACALVGDKLPPLLGGMQFVLRSSFPEYRDGRQRHGHVLAACQTRPELNLLTRQLDDFTGETITVDENDLLFPGERGQRLARTAQETRSPSCTCRVSVPPICTDQPAPSCCSGPVAARPLAVWMANVGVAA